MGISNQAFLFNVWKVRKQKKRCKKERKKIFFSFSLRCLVRKNRIKSFTFSYFHVFFLQENNCERIFHCNGKINFLLTYSYKPNEQKNEQKCKKNTLSQTLFLFLINQTDLKGDPHIHGRQLIEGQAYTISEDLSLTSTTLEIFTFHSWR